MWDKYHDIVLDNIFTEATIPIMLIIFYFQYFVYFLFLFYLNSFFVFLEDWYMGLLDHFSSKISVTLEPLYLEK